MSCNNGGKTRYYYTGNEVGSYNFTGQFDFVSGGPMGSGIAAGTIVKRFFPDTTDRKPWLNPDARFEDKLLDAAYPYIELNWCVDITLADQVFRVSNKPFYVQDDDGTPRFYDPRCASSPSINVDVGEWLNSTYQVSDLSITLNNRDGRYNDFLPYGTQYSQWSSATVRVRVGFGEKNYNYLTVFEGIVTSKTGVVCTRDEIQISAYDKLDQDEIPIPPNVYNQDTFPDIADNDSNKPVPLVYGDWTEFVPAYGAVNAICINSGVETTPASYDFKVSDTSLQSLNSVWLHRGDHTADKPDGPIQIDISQVVLDLSEGKFSIPTDVDTLSTEISNFSSDTCGPGSILNVIAAKDSTIDFVARHVSVGDRVLHRPSNQYGVITAVSSFVLTLSGSGITFAPDDEIVILTKKYAFLSGDKISVTCKGKNLNSVSVTRLGNVNLAIQLPQGVAVGFDQTYWIADDASQLIYNYNFAGKLLRSIPYTSISSTTASITGISLGSNNTIWVADNTNSQLVRMDYAANMVQLVIDTRVVTGIEAPLGNLQGIAIKPDGNIWIVDQATLTFYEINAFSSVSPFVVHQFTSSVFDSAATEPSDIAFDSTSSDLVVVDRNTLKLYRLADHTGTLISSVLLTTVDPDITFPNAVAVAQDGTFFFVDAVLRTMYNYNDFAGASTNPAFIARDLIQQFANHTYSDFDLSWNETAMQVSGYKARVVISEPTTLIKYAVGLLQEFNIQFFLRFGKFSLFFIDFSNFKTDGKSIGEKDIMVDTFQPGKETNQYFNQAQATYKVYPFSDANVTSDQYTSPAGVAFAGRKIPRTFTFDAVYRRQDMDVLMPQLLRLSVSDPEFVQVTFGFRVLRTQMHDFVSLTFDSEIDPVTGLKIGGRRFNKVPCMVRKLSYNLDNMTVAMKLWSLGTTPFPGYTPPGRTVGGYQDKIVLTTVGTPGRISPTGTITAHGSQSVTLADVGGHTAELRTDGTVGQAWAPRYNVGVYDGVTKECLETLTIDTVIGQIVSFTSVPVTSITGTTFDGDGFISGGHYIQYSPYMTVSLAQKDIYASFTKPVDLYPSSKTQELTEQTSGLHNFSDGRTPYVLYPEDYISL